VPTAMASACTLPCAVRPTTGRRWSNCAATSPALRWPTARDRARGRARDRSMDCSRAKRRRVGSLLWSQSLARGEGL
jgi:hypothetical protein